MAHELPPLPFAAATVDTRTAAPVPPDDTGVYNDDDLLDLFKRCKRESFDQRWIFERQWIRNIYYMLNRQWIYYSTLDGQWKDRRLAKWIPRPVTNKCKETTMAIRAIFTDIKLGVNVRPNGEDPKNVSAAATADALHPLLHTEHQMNTVLMEGDWWLIVCGNVFYYSFWDRDLKYGSVNVQQEQCLGCGTITPSDKLQGAQPSCPQCQGSSFQPAGFTQLPQGKGVTLPLSPFELAFPNSYPRFSEVPYVIRLRWRTKSYYENHPDFADQVSRIKFSKTPNDRSLEIFKSLPIQNDLGVAPMAWGAVGSTSQEEEGAAEYELWYKPCAKYPKGLVLRVVGDKDPIVLHSAEEKLPGPFPYTDSEGTPIFPYTHAVYEHVGGRVLGSSALDPIIQKQDQLNQLDSMIQMIIQRMANPIWLEPKGAEVEKFTGEPGLVVKWNPLTAGGNAKPERIAGEGPHGSFFQIREMYLKDIEELTGTYDIIKGARPANVSAFSAMELLDERAKGRFSSVFQSRGDAYKDWFSFAIELEREFGPKTRTISVLSPGRRWTFKNFKTAALAGGLTIVVEDGSTVPKTNLGVRAAVEHASQLGLLDIQNPDVRYEGLKLFGLTKMLPSFDIHVQAALQKQEAFEQWIQNPLQVRQAMLESQAAQEQYQQARAANPAMEDEPPNPLDATPLRWYPWYDPMIHKQEFLKWANGDTIRDLLKSNRAAEGLLKSHLVLIELELAKQAEGAIGNVPLPPVPAGAGAAMRNSNRESTQGNEPRSLGVGQQGHGPA